MEAELRPSDLEVVDAQLCDLIRLLGGPNPDLDLAQQVAAVRDAQGIEATAGEVAALRRMLVERGFSMFHAFNAAIGSRILRPGAPAAIDRFVYGLLGRSGRALKRVLGSKSTHGS